MILCKLRQNVPKVLTIKKTDDVLIITLPSLEVALEPLLQLLKHQEVNGVLPGYSYLFAPSFMLFELLESNNK